MSKFKKGEPRPANAGRKKGSPDIRREYKNLKTALIESGFSPSDALIKLAQDGDKSISLKATLGMLPYLEQALRQTEVKGEVKVKQDIDLIKKTKASLEENKSEM